ncbi:hypothetical protein [Streptomyces sp. SID8014]|uniref:hypothetical protein n=1 Tax=Streptomyces sp. SID8014 TaxID=2706097 RepID=UPI001EF2079D|nr:hypothetical protein [Streptomyces sp. SID8014]
MGRTGRGTRARRDPGGVRVGGCDEGFIRLLTALGLGAVALVPSPASMLSDVR